MIYALGCKIIFRQADYETATIEGSVSLDTLQELLPDGVSTPEEIQDHLTGCLDALIRPWVTRAAEATEFSGEHTSVFAWKELTSAPAASTPAQRKPRR